MRAEGVEAISPAPTASIDVNHPVKPQLKRSPAEHAIALGHVPAAELVTVSGPLYIDSSHL